MGAHSLRRACLLATLGLVLGLVGGGAAWVLIKLIALITNLAILHRVGWTLPSFAHFHPDWTLVPAAVGGGLAVALLARWAPVIRGHGIPEAMEAVLTRQSRVAPRTAVAKPLSAAIAIGTGGPFGAEGPIIVTGGAIGSLLGQVIRMTPAERKILLACGAAAGMAATFGAPLASVVLAIELLLFEFSARALGPLVVSASVAAAVHAQLFGSGPIFSVPAHHFAGLDELPVFAILGLACGLLAVVVCKGLYLVEDGFRRLPVPSFWHPVIGALGFAVVGLLVPRALGVGYDAIDDVLAGRLLLGTLGVLLLAKLFAWWVALGSGTSGGTLAPILLISGCFGGLYAALVGEIVPGVGISTGAIAVVAMSATFGAATRATFTAIVFAFELTGDYRAILPLMLATVIADLVARAFLEHDIMTEKLARRGLLVPRGYEPDVLRTLRVGDAMTADVQVVASDEAARTVAHRFATNGHGAYPVVDEDGRCVGIVSRSDLLAGDADDSAPVVDLATRELVTVRPDDVLADALQRIVEEEVEHLPVVDDAGRLVGICTRTDVLRARIRQYESERPQPGATWPRRARSSRQESEAQ